MDIYTRLDSHNKTRSLICSCVGLAISVVCTLLLFNRVFLWNSKDVLQLTSCGQWNDISRTESSKFSSYLYSSKLWLKTLKKSNIKVPLTNKAKRVFQESYPLTLNMEKIVQLFTKRKGNVSVKAINPFRYKFIRRPSLSSCDRNEKQHIAGCTGVFLIFLIKSHYRNFERRNSIRKTWANKRYFNKSICFQRVFLIGGYDAQFRNIQYKKYIHMESRDNGDVLQMNFSEFYYHNTWKTRGGLKWVEEFCPEAKYVVLVDDDYYVATTLLVQMLQTFGYRLPRRLYMGYVAKSQIPFRYNDSKWFVTKEIFPYDVYPPFVHAGTIVMSREFVRDFNIASQFTKHMIFDDVFLGIVASKLNVDPIHNELFSVKHQPFMDVGFWKTLSSHHYGHSGLLQDAWNCHIQLQNVRRDGHHLTKG